MWRRAESLPEMMYMWSGAGACEYSAVSHSAALEMAKRSTSYCVTSVPKHHDMVWVYPDLVPTFPSDTLAAAPPTSLSS